MPRIFPATSLTEEGLVRVDPDGYLQGCAEAQPERVIPVAQSVLAEARRLSGDDWTMRALMKKARLPRFGKTIERAGV